MVENFNVWWFYPQVAHHSTNALPDSWKPAVTCPIDRTAAKQKKLQIQQNHAEARKGSISYQAPTGGCNFPVPSDLNYIIIWCVEFTQIFDKWEIMSTNIQTTSNYIFEIFQNGLNLHSLNMFKWDLSMSYNWNQSLCATSAPKKNDQSWSLPFNSHGFRPSAADLKRLTG